MAVIDLSDWTPEQYAGEMIKRYVTSSAVEQAAGRREPMKTDTKRIPKDADADVVFTQTGNAYTEDTKSGDQIQLDAAKLTHLSSYNEEDLEDAKAWISATDSKKRNASSNLGLLYDNAALAVTAAQVPGSATRPYISVYNDVATNTPANIIKLVNSGTLATLQTNTRDAISAALQVAEDGEWAQEDLVWVMSPAFKALFRSLDSTGSKGVNFYTPPQGGNPSNGVRGEVGGYPIHWSRAARLAANATHKPTAGIGTQGSVGNAIAVLTPRELLIVGDRAPLESMYLDPKTGIGALSDKAYLKMRRRAAFRLGESSAAAVVEFTSA